MADERCASNLKLSGMLARQLRREFLKAPIEGQIRRRLSGEARCSRACEGQVCARGGKNPSHCLMAVDDREHERGEPELGGNIGVCTRGDEQLDCREMAAQRGEHER